MNKFKWYFEQEVTKAFRNLIELNVNRNDIWCSVRDSFPEQVEAMKEMVASGKLEETSEYNVYLITKEYFLFLKDDIELGVE